MTTEKKASGHDTTRTADVTSTASTRPGDHSVKADSKFLAYVLRHNPDAVGLRLDDAGWVPIDTLLTALAAHGRPITPARLDQLVTGLDKQRLQTRDGRIRAAQGHSIPVDLDLHPATPPDRLYHGTVDRFLARIFTEGLRPMGRHHVHLSDDPATARTVGARRGRPIVLTVDAAAMHSAGHTFHQADNGVWLSAHVPLAHLTVPGLPDPRNS